MKGRYIGNNVRSILDIFEYCEREDKPGALLFLGFQKAYDVVEWNFMNKVLEKFNFGTNFIKWMNILYNVPSFSVKNNGWLSMKQNMTRGIRQGCPLSSLLFIIVVEILGIKIRQNNSIKGFKFGKKEHKNSQYADDEIIMVADITSIHTALDTVNAFSEVAGPKLNNEKVEGIWLGPLKNTMPKRYAGISWSDDAVRCLGIYLGHNKEQCLQMNWTNKLDKIKKLIMQWKRRNLTLIGKIVVIKTFVMPQIIFSASLLRPPEQFANECEKEVRNYIGTKRYRLNTSNIIGRIESGGLGFPDIECTFKALKAA
jgi:hypothetical protein